MKILKKIGLGCLALVICFCSCFKFVNAETDNLFTYNSNDTYYFMVIDYDEFENSAPIMVARAVESDMWFSISYPLDSPTVDIQDPSGENITNVASTYMGEINGTKWYSFTPNILSVANGMTMQIVSNNAVNFSLTPFTNEDNENSFSIYDTIYNLIETYIFGGNIEFGSHQDLTATTLSSIICILVFALPFLIIWKVIKVIMG